MTDDELDDGLLRLLRQARQDEEDDKTNDRTMKCSDLASSVGESEEGESEERVRARLGALEAEGRVRKSAAAPDRWMIVCPGD